MNAKFFVLTMFALSLLSISAYAVNTPPVINAVKFTPATVYFDTKVDFLINASDADLDSLTSGAVFFINGEDSGEFVTGISLVDNSFTPIYPGACPLCNFSDVMDAVGGDVITVDYWVDDGTDNVTGNATLVLANHAPTITANSTFPANIYNDDSWFVNVTARDVDACKALAGTLNDTKVAVYTQFYVNGVKNGVELKSSFSDVDLCDDGFKQTVASLSHSAFNKGDNLTAEFWVGDKAQNTTKFTMLSSQVLSYQPIYGGDDIALAGIDFVGFFLTTLVAFACLIMTYLMIGRFNKK